MLDSWGKKGKERRIEAIRKEFEVIQQEGAIRQEEERQLDAAYSGAVAEDFSREMDGYAIQKLKAPIEFIMQELAPEMKAGTFDIVICDDASARIPTVMMGKIMKRIAERTGNQPPLVRFIAGSTGLYREAEEKRDQKASDLVEYFAKVKDTATRSGRENHQALIITDTIASGESVEELITALRKNGIEATVACMGVVDEESAKRIDKRVPARVVIGMTENAQIYSQKEISGVVKDKTKLFATPNPNIDVDRVRKSRVYAKEVAEEIFQEYEAKNTKL